MKKTPIYLYKKLNEKYGNLNWWPMDQDFHKKHNSDPRFEIIIGAILTQNTAWSNVEKALEKLKEKKLLEIKILKDTPSDKIAKSIIPSGYYNQKASRIKNISKYLYENYDGNLDLFFKKEISNLREELLSLNGIGPETADSIILYAGNLPVFVVDAYTKRICERLPLDTSLSYDEIQKYFQYNLEEKFKENDLVIIYNNLHAQIVIFSKEICKKKPDCEKCFLKNECEYFLKTR